jgi:hypothetical protein
MDEERLKVPVGEEPDRNKAASRNRMRNRDNTLDSGQPLQLGVTGEGNTA